MKTIEFTTFQAVDIRVGTILQAEAFPNARKPAYKLLIDFGAFGILTSSAQITHYYSEESLVGRQIIAVVNFVPKQIANFFSECLVLGVPDADGKVILLQPERAMENGLAVS